MEEVMMMVVIAHGDHDNGGEDQSGHLISRLLGIETFFSFF